MSDLFDSIYCKFCEAISSYGLIASGDKVAVCISGGKDSMLMASLFLRYSAEYNYVTCEYICMDPGYSSANRERIRLNAEKLGIPLHFFETRIFDSVVNTEHSPCYMCARMRRGFLYKNAKKFGCNKIALGHHFDDVIETNIMAMLYSGQYQTMLPMLDSSNYKGMKLIRPLYLIREREVIAWRDCNNLDFLRCACRFTDDSATDEKLSKRHEVKKLIASLEKSDASVPYNIFKSTHNLNVDLINRTYNSTEDTE